MSEATQRRCPVCNKPVVGAVQKRYCCNSCLQKAARRRKHPRKLLLCVVCGEYLSGRQTRYCSLRCQRAVLHTALRRRRGERPDRVQRQCEWCYANFTTCRAFQKFCCQQCKMQSADFKRREALGYASEDYKPRRQTVERIAANIRANRMTEREQQIYAGQDAGKGWVRYGS